MKINLFFFFFTKIHFTISADPFTRGKEERAMKLEFEKMSVVKTIDSMPI